MKYTIHHTCGHEEVVEIYGTNVHGERDRKVAYLESQPCKACINAESTKRNAARNAAKLHRQPLSGRRRHRERVR